MGQLYNIWYMLNYDYRSLRLLKFYQLLQENRNKADKLIIKMGIQNEITVFASYILNIYHVKKFRDLVL